MCRVAVSALLGRCEQGLVETTLRLGGERGSTQLMDRAKVCANCGIAIQWQPTIVVGKTYCCLGCAHGGPCECDYDNLPLPGAVNPIVHQPSESRPERGAG
jgi:hypothetical protein